MEAAPNIPVCPWRRFRSLDTDLPWTTLGGLPETMQTAWGSLFRSLCLEPGEHLLARGATTSVGLAAAALARNPGATVTGTTRSSGNEALLRESGVDQVIIDTGSIADEAMRVRRGGFDKVLEMIGPVTLRDSLCCTREGGPGWHDRQRRRSMVADRVHADGSNSDRSSIDHLLRSGWFHAAVASAYCGTDLSGNAARPPLPGIWSGRDHRGAQVYGTQPRRRENCCPHLNDL